MRTVVLFCHLAPPVNYFCKQKCTFPSCPTLAERQGKKDFCESHISFCVSMLFGMLVITLHSQLPKESLEIVLLDVILQNHHGAPEKWYSFCQIDTGNCVTDHKVSLLELITEKLSQPYHFLWQVCWFCSMYFTIKLISNSHLHNYPSFTFLLIYFFPLSYLS